MNAVSFAERLQESVVALASSGKIPSQMVRLREVRERVDTLARQIQSLLPATEDAIRQGLATGGGITCTVTSREEAAWLNDTFQRSFILAIASEELREPLYLALTVRQDSKRRHVEVLADDSPCDNNPENALFHLVHYGLQRRLWALLAAPPLEAGPVCLDPPLRAASGG
jgi:hypothetical protein